MSVLHVIIAKANWSPKLNNPFIVFDLEWDIQNVSASFKKQIRDLKNIKSDISNHLSGKNSNSDSFAQMEFKEEGVTKATYSSSFSFGKTNQTDWVLYYCCIVDRGANQSKLPSLLKDLHRLLKDNYDPETFTEKTSINRDFTEAWYQTLDNYNLRPLDKKTGAGGQVISYAKVNKANEKVDELKVQLIDNVEGMIRNNKTAEELKANSNNLKEQAKIFERQTSEVEKEVKKKNFWMFSLKWILIFGGIGIFLILAFILIYLFAIK